MHVQFTLRLAVPSQASGCQAGTCRGAVCASKGRLWLSVVMNESYLNSIDRTLRLCILGVIYETCSGIPVSLEHLLLLDGEQKGSCCTL
ncbi:hypothetical protein IRJ41_009317, partial [Triplophysa rosa]